jgi:segregation and condensation protein A
MVEQVLEKGKNLNVLEEPLEVLLALIKKNDVNIYDIPMAKITEQFLAYLDYAVTRDLGELADFYAMAADLIHIKTRMLLPLEQNFDDDDAEDPRRELVERLIEYQRIKKMTDLVEDKMTEQEWSFDRGNVQRLLPFEDEELWQKADTWTLLQDMQKIFLRFRSSNNADILNLYEDITVAEKLVLLEELLESAGECFFTDLLTRGGSMMDAVCAFMAILEAVHIKSASIFQNRMFGDIKIRNYGGTLYSPA